MTVHVFRFDDWYFDTRLNGWTADFCFLIVNGEELEFLPSNSNYHRKKMESIYPDRIEHGTLSRDHGAITETEITDKIRDKYPEVWKVLCKNYRFQSRKEKKECFSS